MLCCVLCINNICITGYSLLIISILCNVTSCHWWIIPSYDLNYWFYWTLCMLWQQAKFFPGVVIYAVISGTSLVISWPRLASFSYTKPAPGPQSAPRFPAIFPAFSWVFWPLFPGFFLRFSRLFGQISQLYCPESLRVVPDNPRDNSWSFRAFSWSSREITHRYYHLISLEYHPDWPDSRQSSQNH